jgi:hypothetical protein
MRLRNVAGAVVFFAAVSCAAGPSPVGTLAMSGRATLSGVVVPDGTLVFPNDVVESSLYKSLLTLPAGDSFNLAPFSRIRVTKSGNTSVIELLQGASGVRLRSAEVRLLASNWSVRANPDVRSGQAAASVIRGADGAVILAVREGQLVASRGGEVLLASANWPVLLPAAAAQKAGQPLAALSPSRRLAGSGGFTLTVNGSNFVSGSVVRWNGSDRPTKFVSSTRLTASIGAGDVAVSGAVLVTVANPSGAVSNPLVFTVYAGGGAPPGSGPAPPGAVGTGKAVVIGAGAAAVAGAAVGVSRLQTKNDTATEHAQ